MKSLPRISDGSRLLTRGTAAVLAAIALTAAANRADAQGSNPTYSVTISGTASGWSFNRSGTLMLASTIDRTNSSRNGVNPIEVGIVSGSPIISPQRGAIQFATNTGLLGARSQLDVAFVSVSGRTITITMAPNISFASSYAVFNVSSGLTADAYFITSGRIVLTLSADGRSISGTMTLSGRGALYGNASYSAQISGIRVR